MQADVKHVVTLSYELRQDNEQGKVIEKTKTEQPFVFLFGMGQLLPDFEQNIKGLKKGENFSFGIPSDKAYGQPNPDAIVNIDKKAFVIDGKLADDLLEVGKVIPMRDEEGHPLNGKVVAVGDTEVKMDFNHPMAGTNLHFTGEVLEVREATQGELDHGHVHGPGGHQH